jgi:hypothetical protein
VVDGSCSSRNGADRGVQGAFLAACPGIRNRTAVSPKASLIKAGAEQSRDKSSSANVTVPRSHVQLLSEISHPCSKLNRQTPEVETTLTSRKQRSANCSNRQKITFCKSENPSSVFATPSPEQLSRSLTQRVLATSHSPLVTSSSNRELLVLEIPQPAANKHRPTVLIENFEPNCTPQPQGRSK